MPRRSWDRSELREILRQNNLDLLREISQLEVVLHESVSGLPSELRPYYDAVLAMQDEIRGRVRQNLDYLDLGMDAILPDLLSSTQTVTRGFAFYNHTFVRPVLRAKPSDRLCLKTLRWLHSAHEQTRQVPVAISDEEVSVVPMNPAIYFLPCSVQHGLLYLPLFFHEIGHLLYTFHRQEMDDLVRDLQGQIRDLLAPSVQRNDQHAQDEERLRDSIVQTWYAWTQELFCDAVGYSIGGPAFASAFSMYLRMRGPDQYQISSRHLVQRAHPVTWLRIRLLADRARRAGRHHDATSLEGAWDNIGAAMDLTEDYYGFYDDSFLDPVQSTIEDMLTETEPRYFQEHEVTAANPDAAPVSPVQLLNTAWQEFLNNPDGYQPWEKRAIESFLATDAPE